MAPRAVLAATALLTTISLSSAYDSYHGQSIYARGYDDRSFDAPLYARSVQKILARRALAEEYDNDNTFLQARHVCGPGCLCGRSVAARDAYAEAEADPIGDALYEHDDVLFNYRRDLDFDIREADPEADPVGDSLYEHDDILFNYRRGLGFDTREADPEADPVGDSLYEHDDILFNYKREADGEGTFFDDVEFFDLVTRGEDPEFEHDDILFNYKREADGGDSYFDDLEFFDVVSRRDMDFDAREANAEASPEADPIGDALYEHDDILFNYKRSFDDEYLDIREAEASPEAEADPVGDALYEHDDILFNYARRDADANNDDAFADLEFTDLISRSASASADSNDKSASYTPWFQSSTAQARKGEYKSPGMLKAEESAKNNGGLTTGGGSAGYGESAGGSVDVAGVGGNAFNDALDAGSAGASSMDAASMEAGGLGM